MTDGQPVSLREWIREQADEAGVPVDELLLQSQRRDPMWKGTRADHAKAEWFARYWRITVEDREHKQAHPRGVHYTIYELDEDVHPPTDCSWSVYRNTDQCDDYLKEASVLARVLGYVPLDGVIDNKHEQTTITEYGEHETEPAVEDLPIKPTGVSVPDVPRVEDRARYDFRTIDRPPAPEAYAEYAADRIARELRHHVEIDQARQAAYHVELWCEKSIPREAKPVARRHGVNVIVEGEGDLSYVLAGDLARRIEQAGKPAVILYCSDFDPKGDNMASAMAGKLAWLKHRGDLTERVAVYPLAVTQAQIHEHDLPRKPISGSDPTATGTGGRAYDTLVTEWEERKGSGAVELQALWKDHGIFLDILRDGLDDVVDPDLPDRTREAREDWQDDLREAVHDVIEDADIDDDLVNVDAWLEAFNDELEDAAEVIEDLRDLVDDGAIADWKDTVEELVDAVDVPAVDVPEGETDLPADPLYDSDRSYGENLRAVRAHEEGRR